MEKDTGIRKAVVGDATAIKNLINRFASEGIMLPQSINQVYEHIRDFWVIEKEGKIIGCGALKITWKDLGEIRSVAVSSPHQAKGLGRLLVQKILKEASDLKLKRIFTLTYVPDFFARMGFEKVAKSKLPHKVWIDCINCPKFPRCDEVSMIKHLENDEDK